MKPNKYTLLEKEQKREGDYQNYGDSSPQGKKESGAPYSRLEEDFDEKHLEGVRPPNSASTNPKKPINSSNPPYQPPPQPRVVTYDISGAQNSILHIGPSGITVQQRAPYIPPVLVDCEKCKAKQQIPGNAQEFICYGCHERNAQIEPKFGIFICGICHNHVCYPYRTHEHIQCNICFTVNKVPIEPQSSQKGKKNEAVLPRELREEEIIANENGEYSELATAISPEDQRQTFK